MIIIFFGLPGTGKTFLSRELTKHIPARHIQSDQVRSRLNKRGTYIPSDKQLVYDQMFREADAFIQNGESVILDATFTSSENRMQAMELAKKWRQPVYFIWTTAAEDVIKNRVSSKREDSEADYSVYQQLKKNFDPVQVPHLQVDTSLNNTHTTMQLIFNFIQE